MTATQKRGCCPSYADPWIKVCGVRNFSDLECAAAAGATHAGFNTWPQSPRHIEPANVTALSEAAERLGLTPVLLLVPGSRPVPLKSSQAALWLQSATPVHSWLGDGHSVLEARTARPESIAAPTWGDALLLDAHFPGKPGGTGLAVDRVLALQAPRPFVLAGGLNPDNVAAAIAAVAPAGVDAASGLESSPGVKDSGRVRAFCQAAREAFSRLQQQGEADGV